MTDVKRVFLVKGDAIALYAKMFKDRGWEITNNIMEADLVQFLGGSDVSPELYGEKKHPKTFSNPARDKFEQSIYEQALELGLPMAGICRGGQFLHVMNGGKMWQDVDNHMKTHVASLPGPLGEIEVSSDHHQMMRVNEFSDHVVLLTALESEWLESVTENGEPIATKVHAKTQDDVEAIYYPITRCLCFQPHPEYPGFSECQQVYFYFIDNYLFANLNDIEVMNDLYSGDIIPF